MGAPLKAKKEKAEAKGRGSSKVSYGEAFSALSMLLFDRVGRSLARALELDKAFLRAGMTIHPIKYAAETILATVVAGATVAVGLAIFLIFTPAPLPIKVVAVTAGSMIPLLVFVVRLWYPYTLATLRRVETENELPFFLAYVATMARGGHGLEKVIERVAQLKAFRAIRSEARRILTRVKMFGEDPITAIDRVASSHPSSKFRDLMLGYTTTLRSGGDVLHYLEVRTREIFEARASEVRAVMYRLMSYLQLYIIFGVIVSVSIFVFFAVNAAVAAVQAARVGPITVDITMPSLYNFVVMPIMGFMILYSIHLSQPRTPINYGRVYATLLTSAPLAAIAFVLVLTFTGGSAIIARGALTVDNVKSFILALASGIVVASAPASLSYSRLLRGHKGLIKAAADALRDLSEVRKTGLSPEKCLIAISSRSYGNLTPVIERVAAALTLGASLEEALRSALKGVREWFVLAIFRFLVDSITVGGGSPEVMDTLARFTQTLSELEEETRKRMRFQIFLPYFGSILLAAMPTIILYMLLALANISLEAATPLLFVLSAGSMVNAYIMGLVAGKASATTLAAGFKHAIILSLVSAAASLVALAYVGAA